jgi:hypothetical protein
VWWHVNVTVFDGQRVYSAHRPVPAALDICTDATGT